jgi:murein DD-endopeptidase MepM/ murein hydrolase activator NlpD
MARSTPSLLLAGLAVLTLVQSAAAQILPGQNELPGSVRLRQPILHSHPSVTQLNAVLLTGIARDAVRVEIIAPGQNCNGSTRCVVPVVSGQFSALVPLLANQPNPVAVRSIAPGQLLSAPVLTTITHDTEGPSLQVDFPLDGGLVTSQVISVVGRVIDTLGGIESVTVAGLPGTLLSGGPGVADFSLTGFVLQPAGVPSTINLIATDGAGNATAETLTVTYVVSLPGQATLALESGENQSGAVNLELSQPLVAEVLDENGLPWAGKIVTFDVTLGGGLLSSTSGGPRSPSVSLLADGAGLTTVWWTLGPQVGTANNRVNASSSGVTSQVGYQASAAVGFQNEVHVISGDDQSTEVNTFAPLPLRVRVKNGTLGIPSEPVTFTVIAGNGKVFGQNSVVINTDGAGYASVGFQLGPFAGDHVVDATITGAISPATFSLNGVERNPLESTSLAGVVFDHADHPLGGVTVEVLSGISVIASTTTDVMGRFDLPALTASGALTLQCLGGTATTVSGQPLVGSYPDHTQPVVVVPNGRNELPKPLVLPLRQPGNVARFDNTSTVVLTLPEVEGFQMTVHPGSMKLADGTIPNAGTPVTLRLNQVHHDKVGFNIPNGSESVFSFVLEPFGAQFGPQTGIPGAKAIDLEMPNILGLSPGTQVDFYRFDPSTGAISIVASGNVVGNGSIVATGAGSGVTAGGCVLKGGFFGQSLTYQAPDPCTTAASEIPTTIFLPVAGGTIRSDPCGSGAFGILHGSEPNPGVDISGALGAPVVTVYDGTVFAVQSSCVADPGCVGASASCGSGYGNFVVVEHSLVAPSLSRFYTAYCQLDTVVVNPGDFVTAGMSLGTLGQTGNANPACLPCAVTPYVHFELSASVPPLTAEIPRCDPSTYLVSLLPPVGSVASLAFENFSGQTVLQASGEIGFPTQATLARINNVAAPTQGQFTLRSTWIVGEQIEELNSPFDELSMGSQTLIAQDVDPDPDGAPVHIDASLPISALNPLQTVQATVTAFDEQNVGRNATARTAGTFYRTSNPAIVTVGNTDLDAGEITAQGVGTAYVTAVNEGTVSTVQVTVTGATTTIVQGIVQTPGGSPHAGATITVVPGNLTGTSDGTGLFTITDVPATEGDLTLLVDGVVASDPKTATVTGLAPLPGTVTDAGVIVLEDAIYWAVGTSGTWSVGSNWSTGSPPNPGDNVIIDRPETITVTLSSDAGTMKSIRCENTLTLGTSGRVVVTQPFQVNGTLTLDGGTLEDSTLLPGQPGYSVVATATPTTLDNVTLSADLTMPTSSAVSVMNGLVLGGTITMSYSGGPNIDLHFFGTQTLSGTGTISMSSSNGPAWALLRPATSDTLTIEAGVTIEGEGAVGQSGATVVNRGTIRANVSGRELWVRGAGWSNEGVIEAVSGGTIETFHTWTNMATGTITAVSGGLELNAASQADAWSNLGAIIATSSTVELGGMFTLSGLGSFSSTGGTVDLTGNFDLQSGQWDFTAATGSWFLRGGTFRNGTITSSGGAGVTATTSFGFLNNVTLAGELTMPNSSKVRVLNGLVLDGTITMSWSSGGNTDLQFLTSQTLSGTGTLNMSSNGVATGCRVYAANASDTLTIETGVLIEGEGAVGFSTTTVVNRGTIRADQSGLGMIIYGINWSNEGTLEAVSGGRLLLRDSWSNTGVITSTNSTVDLGGVFTLAGLGTLNRTAGTVDLSGTLNLEFGQWDFTSSTGSWNLKGGTFVNGTITSSGGEGITATTSQGGLDNVALQGDLTMPGNSRVSVRNGLTLDGTIAMSWSGGATTTLEYVAPQTWTGTGTVTMSSSGVPTGCRISGFFTSTLTIDSGLTIEGEGQLGLAPAPIVNRGTVHANLSGGEIQLVGPWTNEGICEADTGATIRATVVSTFTQTTGSIVLSGGTFRPQGALDIQGGEVRGDGTIDGAVSMGGTIRPGGTAAAGVITVSGDYTQTPGGTFECELGGTALTAFDRIVGGGGTNATLAGTLDVTLINAFSPSGSDLFQVVDSLDPSATTFTTETFPLGPITIATAYSAVGVRLDASCAPQTTLDSREGPNLGNNGSRNPSLSADGRCVAFQSFASNLVAGDVNGVQDVFVTDRYVNTPVLASVSTGGTQGNGESEAPAVSADGRWVAFQSLATNLVPGDTNSDRDVFLRDLQTNATTRASVATGGGQVSGDSNSASISADGRWITFRSTAALVPEDTNGFDDVYVHDRIAGTTVRASVGAAGAQGNGGSTGGSISDDGRYVAFSSTADNLVAVDANGSVADVFVRDLQSGTTTLESVSTGGVQGAGGVPVISGNGRYVAFHTTSAVLVAGDTNGANDVFLRDLQAGTTIRISVDSLGNETTSGQSFNASVSSDGSRVAFYSTATNLVAGDTNGTGDVFVRGWGAGTTERWSVSSAGGESNGSSDLPSISGDGSFVAFDSLATNLVAGDTNGTRDVFTHFECGN